MSPTKRTRSVAIAGRFGIVIFEPSRLRSGTMHGIGPHASLLEVGAGDDADDAGRGPRRGRVDAWSIAHAACGERRKYAWDWRGRLTSSV